ncbi:SLC13 family permease [Halococcus sp. IIIV-5B]|uniref:SLC13 family permease n=1 Tax=Halococcus sp. IIIV-5B TaxID=2321230 RepID=UPI000E718EAC|nr:anion transporter [Halococcus sp. IIIV-5B]
MIQSALSGRRGMIAVFAVAVIGTIGIAFAPTPGGLSIRGQYALATMFFVGMLWVTGALPLAVTALCVPILLTGFGVYPTMDEALAGFADHIIFLFLAGFMLANALQKYDIDRRIALSVLARMGTSPRKLVAAVMLATAFLSMWVSNTATAAMMMPIALGVLAQVLGREAISAVDDNPNATIDSSVSTDGGESVNSGVAATEDDFRNLQVAMLLGTAYAASVGGVGTLIGTPPNAILAGQLSSTLNYDIGFVQWLAVGLPIVVITLPIIWYLLTYVLYPPRIDDVSGARQQAQEYLREEGELSTRGKRVVYIFSATAFLWVIGGLGSFVQPYISAPVYTTLFGGEGPTLLGVSGHGGLLYYVLIGLAAVPALVLADTMEWDELVDIDWGTLLLFGGGIALANALADSGATEWIADTVFGGLVGAPILLVILVVVLLVIFLTEMTSNAATTSIIAPILIGLGGIFAGTLGLGNLPAALFLAVSGTIAASFAFALPVATPPNAIVFGSGYVKQDQMIRAGVVLNLLMTFVLVVLIWVMFQFLWPLVLW